MTENPGTPNPIEPPTPGPSTPDGSSAHPAAPAKPSAPGQARRKLIDATTWKFILVGIVNTIVGTTVMFLAYNWLGFGYWVSSALNYIIGSIVSFVLNKYFTFQNKERSLRQVWLFILNIAACYLVAYGLAKPLVYALTSGLSVKVADNLSMGLGMILFVALNYAGQRFVVFASKTDAAQK